MTIDNDWLQNSIPPSEESTITSSKTDLLNKEDVKLLNALASNQLNYGHIREAIALLILCRLAAPKNIQTLRLLTLAYIRLEWWEKAEMILQEYNYYSEKQSKFSHLYAALCSLGQARFSEAREYFHLFQKKLFQRIS